MNYPFKARESHQYPLQYFQDINRQAKRPSAWICVLASVEAHLTTHAHTRRDSNKVTLSISAPLPQLTTKKINKKGPKKTHLSSKNKFKGEL